MARPAKTTTKRPTAANREKAKQRKRLTLKLKKAAQEQNARQEKISELQTLQVEGRGRIATIMEEVEEFGGPDPSVLPGK